MQSKEPVSIPDPNFILRHSCVARDLYEAMTQTKPRKSPKGGFAVMIEMNNNFPGGARTARAALVASYLINATNIPDQKLGFVAELLTLADLQGPYKDISFGKRDVLNLVSSSFTEGYLFGSLSRSSIKRIAKNCRQDRNGPIYKIWLDQPFQIDVYRSYKTIKCDAARIAFGAQGEGIVWAVADTGIDATHPHFRRYKTLEPPPGLTHCDFTEKKDESEETSGDTALIDIHGHGTHVAGIIAGETDCNAKDENGNPLIDQIEIIYDVSADGVKSEEVSRTKAPDIIQGIAPWTRIISLKVLKHPRDKNGISSVMSAIGYIQRINEYGRNIRIHGLNLSLSYDFQETWFAAGHSPVCKEVNRLVRSGVVVVISAGNAGFGYISGEGGAIHSSASTSTIGDPGNAELAITVGSTHRDRPHEYGVSYFSAKGPTIDGRLKPDLLAPGERIVSCDPGKTKRIASFKERSGTSMAAPHVSGMIAALLSVRREFIGQPERVKSILMESATDLGRVHDFQGAGLADLMRAMQSI
ncbi:S8 family peptidase [Paracoccaceae bacterium GXU_MW_L88]